MKSAAEVSWFDRVRSLYDARSSRHVSAVWSWSPRGQHSSCGEVRGVASGQGLRPDMMLECRLMWRCCVGSTTSAARGLRWRNSGLWWPRSAIPMSGPTSRAATYCSFRRRGPAALMVRQTRRRWLPRWSMRSSPGLASGHEWWSCPASNSLAAYRTTRSRNRRTRDCCMRCSCRTHRDPTWELGWLRRNVGCGHTAVETRSDCSAARCTCTRRRDIRAASCDACLPGWVARLQPRWPARRETGRRSASCCNCAVLTSKAHRNDRAPDRGICGRLQYRRWHLPSLPGRIVYEILEATLQRRLPGIEVDEEAKRDAAARISVGALTS